MSPKPPALAPHGLGRNFLYYRHGRHVSAADSRRYGSPSGSTRAARFLLSLVQPPSVSPRPAPSFREASAPNAAGRPAALTWVWLNSHSGLAARAGNRKTTDDQAPKAARSPLRGGPKLGQLEWDNCKWTIKICRRRCCSFI